MKSPSIPNKAAQIRLANQLRRCVTYSNNTINRKPINIRSCKFHDGGSWSCTSARGVLCANWYVQTGMCKLVCAKWYVQTGMCKLVCANWYVQTGMCKLLCANWYVQTAMCKLLCANWLCKLVCANWYVQNDIFACNFLNNGPILIFFFLFESSWSPLSTLRALVELHERSCNSTSARATPRALMQLHERSCNSTSARATARAAQELSNKKNWSKSDHY